MQFSTWCSALGLLLALLAAPVVAGRATARPPYPKNQRDHIESVDARLAELARPLMDGGWMKGACIGVIAQGRTRVLAFGQVRPGGAAPDETTLFEIGSITKAMTAALVADRVLRGEAALADPLARHLPGLAVPAHGERQITLEDLLTQSAGLPPLPADIAPADPQNPYADYSAAQLETFVSGFTLPRPPGERYEYSNVGFALLGLALARGTGRSYEELLAARIFAPLGMIDTGIVQGPGHLARMAQPHDADGEPTPPWDFLVFDAAGAVRSNVRDMLRWLEANMRPDASPLGRALALTHAPRRPSDTPQHRIGLAWHVANGTSVVWHNGGTGGSRAFTGWSPEHQVGVVVLTNSGSDEVERLGWGALAHLTGAPYSAPPLPVDAPLEPATARALAGVYRHSTGAELTITCTLAAKPQPVVRVQAPGERAYRMHPTGPDAFVLRVAPVTLTFQRDAAGRPSGMLVGDQLFRRVESSRTDEGSGR